MSILLDRLPTAITICGRPVPINTDYRYLILFEQLCLDRSLSQQEKVEKVLLLMFDDIYAIPLEEPQQIVDGLLWFYQGGDRQMNAYQLREKKRAEARREDEDEQTYADEKRYYDFDYDDERIYAAFKQLYGIDLADIRYLHWWKFKALLSNLTDETKFMQVVGYRAANITKDMTDSQKKFHKKMKELYALPIPQDEIEKTEAIETALQNGDVATIMKLIGKEGKNG